METSNQSFWPRDRVAEKFTVSTTTLLKWERHGFVKAVRMGDLEGYGPLEIRRVWTILTFQRDLGINLAGVEVILRLLDQMRVTHSRLDTLASALSSTLQDSSTGEDDHA